MKAGDTYTAEEEREAYAAYLKADEAFEELRAKGGTDGGLSYLRMHNAWRAWTMIRAIRNEAAIRAG